MSFELALFYAFAALAVLGAVAMVGFVRHVVAGAMSLVLTMVSLAGIYVLLGAHFVAALQVMVYAGAIVVLFLFVVMLLDLRRDDFGPSRPGQRAVKLVASGLAVALCALVARRVAGALPAAGAPPEGFGGFRDLGLALFTTYVVPLEVAGLLLLAAIVAAVILAKERPRGAGGGR
ncbi:MAG: NADH-quinone oxidoreductase subunit J [Myxococcota bacterium]|nr:NADH-quinone oxidoreductase subunit J [Myxococcales bacterium]